MSPREGSVSNDGVALHYLEWGGDGPPLVLLHATGFLAALWRPIAERLSARFRVIAVDQRGHGGSDKPAGAYRFEAFAGDLQRVIEELELERPLAAGHSSGGTTIVVHGALHPGVLRRAALIEPILPRPDWYASAAPGGRTAMSLADGARKRRAVWRDREEIYRSYRVRPTFQSWRDDILRLYVDEGTRERPDGQVELACPPAIEGQFFDAVRHLEPWPMLERLEAPALVLWGAESHLHGRGLDRQVDGALPRGRTVIVPDATHFLPQERPDEVARLLEEFLSD